jgi:hypothetical protein
MSNNMKEGTLYYTLRPIEPGGFSIRNIRTCRIQVGITKYSGRGDEIEFTAQDDIERKKFYAGSVTAYQRIDYQSEMLALAARLSRAMAKQKESMWDADHVVLLKDALKSMRAVHAVYDCRVSEMVEVKDVLPPAYAPWRDDYMKMGRVNGCSYSAMARDDDEARSIMILSFKSSNREGGYNAIERQEYFESWMKAGAPIKRLTGDGWRAPEVVQWDDMFAHQKEAVA